MNLCCRQLNILLADVYEIPFVSVTDNGMINGEGNLTKETALKYKVAEALVKHVSDIKTTGKGYYLLLSVRAEDRQQPCL